jgi:hypothetical protein
MDCPTCGKSLNTEQGMRQHHTKVHGDPLPNRTCEECEERFYDPKARRTYCEDCYTGAGRQNGNWKDAKEQAECERCGDEFEYYPLDKDGVYCSACVEAADEFLGTPSYAGEEFPRTERECEHCGEVFTVLNTTLRREPCRFCSQECLYNWMSNELYDGARHETHTEASGGQCDAMRGNETIVNVRYAAETKQILAGNLTCIISHRYGNSSIPKMLMSLIT